MSRPSALGRYGKALGSGVGHALVYLIGVMTAEDGFSDLATVQWLGAVLAFLIGAGVVAAIPKGDEVVRVDASGQLRAGPAALQRTDSRLGGGARLDDLMSVDHSGTLQED